MKFVARHYLLCSGRKNAGFSLVELLTGIGIAVILGALLVPTLQHSRKAADQTRCAGNLRSLIQGWSLYSGDHDGKTVVFGVHADPSGKYQGWISQLLPYLGSGNIDQLLLCPSARVPTPSGTRGSSWYAWKYFNGKTAGSYGLNASWYDRSAEGWPGGEKKYYKRLLNGRPTEGPVFSDACWVDFERSYSSGPGTDYETAKGAVQCAIVRHGGKGVNMAFADGSVRLISMGELYSMKLDANESVNPNWRNLVPEQYR